MESYIVNYICKPSLCISMPMKNDVKFCFVLWYSLKVFPPEATQPANENDTSPFQSMSGYFMKEFNGRLKSGNEMSAIRLMGATASFFKYFSNVNRQ